MCSVISVFGSRTQYRLTGEAGERLLTDSSDDLNLYWDAARQFGNTYRAAGVTPRLPEGLNQKGGRSIYHLRLLIEPGCGGDETGNFENADDTPEVTQLRLELSQGLEHAGLGSPLRLLEAHVRPGFPGHHDLPARPGNLAADVRYATVDDHRNILECRSQRLRQPVPLLRQPRFDLSARHRLFLHS